MNPRALEAPRAQLTLPNVRTKRPYRRRYLTPTELREITEQLEALEAPKPARSNPAPAPEQLAIPLPVPQLRGALLCLLARSDNPHERRAALDAVRAELERTRSAPTAARALEVTPRWVQLLIKTHPTLCQGLTLRTAGRPPKENTDDDQPRLHAARDARRDDSTPR